MDLSLTPPPPPYILNGEFFEILAQEGDSVTVRCCYCDTNRNIFKGSVKSTGNFHMHIKRKHPELVPKVNESKLRAFMCRKSMQQSRFRLAQRRYIKAEKDQLNANLIPIKIEPQAIDPQNNPNFQINPKIGASSVKCEPLNLETNNRHIRNIFAQPKNLTLPKLVPTTQNLSTTNTFNLNQQIEPTNLSQNQSKGTADNILPRIESTLRSIDREMRFRNQIESNRLLLELAKFKYINPDFHFRF